MVRAIEMTGCKRELAKFAPRDTAVELAVISRERHRIVIKELADCPCRRLAVFKSARDALTHQRVNSCGISRQNDASLRIAITPVKPANWRGPEVSAPTLKVLKWKLGERALKLAQQRRVLAARSPRGARVLIIDADVQMWPPLDQTRKRPRVTLYADTDATKVEAVALRGELNRRLCINFDVGHQRAPDGGLVVAKSASADDATRAIGTDQYAGLEVPAFANYLHQAALLRDVDHPTMFHDLEPRRARLPRQQRIELIAPHYRSDRLIAMDNRIADDRSRSAALDRNRRDVERNAQLLQRQPGLRNQASRASLEAWMAGLLQCHHSAAQVGARLDQIKGGGKPGRPGSGDQNLAFARWPHRAHRPSTLAVDALAGKSQRSGVSAPRDAVPAPKG